MALCSPSIMSKNDNRTSESTLFVDHEDVRHCISVLTTDTTTMSARDDALIQLRAIFDKYLECPSLLDANLEEIISCLNSKCSVAVSPTEQPHFVGTLRPVQSARTKTHSALFPS